MNRLITITKERLAKAKTPKGGYRKAQLQLLDVAWPLKEGWKKDLIGKKVTLARFIEFVRAGKNKVYLAEINSLLPTLNPPIEPAGDIVDISTCKPQKNRSRRLSKKDLKRERAEAKRARLASERENKIRTYGVHKCVRLVIDKSGETLHYPEKEYLLSLLQKTESVIPSNNIRRLYNTMKKHCIVLSYTQAGAITMSGFTMVSEVRRTQLLYVIRQEETNYCKIGVSKDPGARKRALQTSSPSRLNISLVFESKKPAVKLEKSLHKHFHTKRKSGEWFQDVSDEAIVKVVADRATLLADY